MSQIGAIHRLGDRPRKGLPVVGIDQDAALSVFDGVRDAPDSVGGNGKSVRRCFKIAETEALYTATVSDAGNDEDFGLAVSLSKPVLAYIETRLLSARFQRESILDAGSPWKIEVDPSGWTGIGS